MKSVPSMPMLEAPLRARRGGATAAEAAEGEDAVRTCAGGLGAAGRLVGGALATVLVGQYLLAFLHEPSGGLEAEPLSTTTRTLSPPILAVLLVRAPPPS